MLNEFMREQDEKQAQLRQQRINSEKARTTKRASIQCDRWDVLEKSNVAVQTEFPDLMDDLKEQIRQLTKIVADLTALKNRHQGNVPNNQLNDEDILMDSLSDVLPFDAELSSNQPVPETPPEGPAQAPSMTQSVPLAVVNSGAMLQPPSLQPSLRSPLSTIDQNAPFVQRRYSSHRPTDDHRQKVELIVSFGSNIITTAMACVDILFTDKELANGNTSGSNGYRQLDELKLLFLESTLHRKFESPVFTSQWESVRTRINTKCRGKRRTVIRRLQKNTIF